MAEVTERQHESLIPMPYRSYLDLAEREQNVSCQHKTEAQFNRWTVYALVPSALAFIAAVWLR